MADAMREWGVVHDATGRVKTIGQEINAKR